MTDKNSNSKSTAPANQPRIKSQTTSPGQFCGALLQEMVALARSGESPARLQELLAQHQALRVARIDEILAQERHQRLPRLRALTSTLLDAMQPVVEALNRQDLTFPELLRLAKLHQRNS